MSNYRDRERHYRRLAGLPAPPLDPWNVAWQPHNKDIDLALDGRTFLIRARVDRATVEHFLEVASVMAGILNLGPPPSSPFAWPVLPNTWTGEYDAT